MQVHSVPFDYETARFNMIEQQIRPWNVLDQTVLNLFADLHREDFVPENYRTFAFSDIEIPLGKQAGQHMLLPILEGRILQLLQLNTQMKVLQIGVGSGYLTACFAKLVAQVTAIEIDESLLAGAQQKLQQAQLSNVEWIQVDAFNYTPAVEAYDAIVFTGSVAQLDAKWREALALNGRLFVVEGEAPAMRAMLITRRDATYWQSVSQFETVLSPLLQAQQEIAFIF